MRGRRWIIVGSAFTSVTVIGVACSFPDPEIRALDGAVGQSDGPVLTDVVVLVDGESPDALIVQDAGKKIATDAACATSLDCDCDKDGFKRPNCGDDSGTDCDDTDQRVRPDQGFLDIPTEPPRNGDWNCKNGIEELYPTEVKCSGISLGTCSGIQGFRDKPKCGEVGTYIFCAQNGLLCEEGATQSRTQACK